MKDEEDDQLEQNGAFACPDDNVGVFNVSPTWKKFMQRGSKLKA